MDAAYVEAQVMQRNRLHAKRDSSIVCWPIIEMAYEIFEQRVNNLDLSIASALALISKKGPSDTQYRSAWRKRDTFQRQTKFQVSQTTIPFSPRPTLSQLVRICKKLKNESRLQNTFLASPAQAQRPRALSLVDEARPPQLSQILVLDCVYEIFN